LPPPIRWFPPSILQPTTLQQYPLYTALYRPLPLDPNCFGACLSPSSCLRATVVCLDLTPKYLPESAGIVPRHLAPSSFLLTLVRPAVLQPSWLPGCWQRHPSTGLP
jgi:hypothetical protein